MHSLATCVFVEAKGKCQIPGAEVISSCELLGTELWVLGMSLSPLKHLSSLYC